jgi:hypothetical protein
MAIFLCPQSIALLSNLTLSCRGTQLVRDLVLGIHNSPNNGPINIIPSRKLIDYVLPIHFACSIMKIGPLVA